MERLFKKLATISLPLPLELKVVILVVSFTSEEPFSSMVDSIKTMDESKAT